MKTETTDVVFRTFKRGGDVIALFPGHIGTVNRPDTCNSYQHIGQHGAASASLAGVTRPATPAERAPLARELRRIGYRLRTVKRGTPKHYRARLAQCH